MSIGTRSQDFLEVYVVYYVEDRVNDVAET